MLLEKVIAFGKQKHVHFAPIETKRQENHFAVHLSHERSMTFRVAYIFLFRLKQCRRIRTIGQR